MKLTIDIDAATLESLKQLTRQSEAPSAVAAALTEYLRLKSTDNFLNKVIAGHTDYRASNDQIEALTNFDN